MFCDEDFCLESGSWGGFCDLVTKRSLLDCDCVLGVQLWVLEGLRSVHWVQSGICPRLGVFTHREVTRVTSGQKNFWCMDFMWVFWCCSGRSMLSSLYSVEKQSVTCLLSPLSPSHQSSSVSLLGDAVLLWQTGNMKCFCSLPSHPEVLSISWYMMSEFVGNFIPAVDPFCTSVNLLPG